VDLICHSDTVFSAVCSAMSKLGLIEEWLAATAKSEGPPAVRFSSLFPFHGDRLLIVPPRSIWPPAESTKVRYKGARFVPLPVVEALLADKGIDEDRWAVDGVSECLVPHDAAGGPFRITLRSNAAVDRIAMGVLASHETACMEFARDSGLWTVVQFADDDAAAHWTAIVHSAFLLLADSGLGGERSRGWGRSEAPEWEPWSPPAAESLAEGAEWAYWLLSVYSPSDQEAVDWKRGSYLTVSRRGRIESAARWGELKDASLMIAEGSVLLTNDGELRGVARDVAPPGFPHPVYRAGFAVAVPIPWRAAA
jgi:CRISPR-associated protein Csm4